MRNAQLETIFLDARDPYQVYPMRGYSTLRYGDLVDKHLVGKKRAEVIEMLGEPSTKMEKS